MERRSLIKGLLTGYVALQTGKSFGQDGSVSATTTIDPELATRIQFKAKHFDQDFPDDVRLDDLQKVLLLKVVSKLTQAKKATGFGNFNLISYEELLKVTANSPLGAFDKAEIEFMENLFGRDAREYGFYGAKVSTELNTKINRRQTTKMAGTGHFLYRGRPEVLYAELKKDIGSDIVLTSGIRSIVKQLDLFLNKAIQCGGNLSRASRSLAPPGYSFHGIGDFDVGKVGLGADNFTDSFATTDVYKRLIDLGYVNIRYTQANFFGVRFEPWHIKVVT